MRISPRTVAPLLLLLRWMAFADPAADLRDAVTALSRTSYSWETTTRQRFSGENTDPRLNPNAPIEIRGKADPDGYTQLTALPSRTLAVPVTAVFRQGDVVVQTPLGWWRRTDMRQVPGPDRQVEFEGQQVRLSRFLTAALKVAALRPVTEELFDLAADLKSCRTTDGLLIAELRDPIVERLWGDAQAARAPELHGTVIFKTSAQGITEFHVVLGIGFPNSRTNKIAWTMQQWSTRLTSLGSARVEPPAEAVSALDK